MTQATCLFRQATMITNTLTKPSALAKIGETVPEEGGRWEIRLEMILKSSGREVTMKAMADFVRLGQQFSGQTMVVYYMGEQGGPGFDADVEGELSETDVRLDLNMLEGDLRGASFQCSGTASAKGKRYEGRWHMPCIDPVECGCEGDDGDFSLTRVA